MKLKICRLFGHKRTVHWDMGGNYVAIFCGRCKCWTREEMK